jgi:thiol-disulfide isomerase/thioredoxin
MDPSTVAWSALSSSTFGPLGKEDFVLLQVCHGVGKSNRGVFIHLSLTIRCEPCVRAAPELSDLTKQYARRVAIVGVNNENMFREIIPCAVSPKEWDQLEKRTLVA